MHRHARQPSTVKPRARLWKPRTWRNTEAGQSLVEFTMILPIFLLLLFGLVDFGRGFYSWMLLTNAAREGARAAAVQLDSSAVDAKIYDSLCSSYPSDCSLDMSKMAAPTKTNVQGTRGSEASVDLSYQFQFVTPIGGIAKLFGSTISAPTLTAHSSMRLE